LEHLAVQASSDTPMGLVFSAISVFVWLPKKAQPQTPAVLFVYLFTPSWTLFVFVLVLVFVFVFAPFVLLKIMIAMGMRT
jgi:hypothetical protein